MRNNGSLCQHLSALMVCGWVGWKRPSLPQSSPGPGCEQLDRRTASPACHRLRIFPCSSHYCGQRISRQMYYRHHGGEAPSTRGPEGHTAGRSVTSASAVSGTTCKCLSSSTERSSGHIIHCGPTKGTRKDHAQARDLATMSILHPLPIRPLP